MVKEVTADSQVTRVYQAQLVSEVFLVYPE